MPDLALRGISPELHEALKRAAERNHRSLNGEILARLEASARTSTVDVEILLARIQARRARTSVPRLSPETLRALKQPGRP
ncbi:Arc family DNA-binding protein [Gemmatimonadota bacterium]